MGIGYTTDAIWARIGVENCGGRDQEAELRLGAARLGRVAWWVLDGDRIVEHAEDGVDVAAGRGSAGRHPELSFHVPAWERRDVYVRVESDTAIRILPKLAAGGVRGGGGDSGDLAEFGFVGAGAAVLLMSLLLGAAQRNGLYALLAAIVGAFLGYYMLFHGYYVWLGGPWQRWANRNLVLALGLAGHGALLEFTVSFFRLSGVPGRSAAWLRRITVGLGAGALAVSVLPFRLGLATMGALLAVCFAAGFPASVGLALRKRAWPHWLLGAVWAMAGLLLGTTYAGLYAWLPAWMEPEYSQRLFLLLFFLMAFTIVAGQRQMERRDRERALLAEQSATAAQLQALRYQLNPHFLYNTLTSIEALSRRAPGRIPELVRKLSVYLRLRLHASADGMATVESEMESIRAYLGIEQVRFAESLRVNYEIRGGVEACRVPEMLFQPLVGNAIKHGMPPEGILEILIRMAREGGQLIVGVENTGCLGGTGGNSCAGGGGVGLRNVRERLARVYGNAARFDLREEAGRVVAEIRLPIEEGVS